MHSLECIGSMKYCAIAAQVSADILPSLHVVVRSPAVSQPNGRQIQPKGGPSTAQRPIQPAPGQTGPQRLAGIATASPAPANAAGSSVAAGSPFAHSNGAGTPHTPFAPATPLVPLSSLQRAPSASGQPQVQPLRAVSSGLPSGTLPSTSTQSASQTSPSPVHVPAAQLPLPRPQARPQHGPVNAGPTLHPLPGSQVTLLASLPLAAPESTFASRSGPVPCQRSCFLQGAPGGFGHVNPGALFTVFHHGITMTFVTLHSRQSHLRAQYLPP